jgi:hypothetical protein
MQAYADVDYNDMAICNRRTENADVYDFSFFLYFSWRMEEMKRDISIST